MNASHVLESIRPLIGVMTQLPPPPQLELDTRTRAVCACGRRVLASELKRTTTPLIPQAQTDVCEKCPDKRIAVKQRERAQFFCIGCGDMVMATPPHTHKQAGLDFLAGGNYHINGCANCAKHVRTGLMRSRHPDASPEQLEELSLKGPYKILEVALKEDKAQALREMLLILQLKNNHHVL